ncbi:ATP-binding cassette sub-family A member 6-like [Suncus etruscus]|uniref:ATP-binding cassette sub-family A member 6-like n=1 Tax=Suncus etruscus TaxID=109475 RepID=UPI00210F7927|nr:ATP-binding cassette sub-family A member 6-like [Suncus etruscus]
MLIKQKSLFQQTQALLCKNLLVKWRSKGETALELGIPILLGLYVGLFFYFQYYSHFPGMPPRDLGRLDQFNSSLNVVYAPISKLTQQIMNQTILAPFMTGVKVIGAANETHLDKIIEDNLSDAAGIVFNDMTSYHLKFYQGYFIPSVKADEFTAYCFDMYDRLLCSLDKYWTRGFMPLQTAINVAIIQILTNHSVMEQLMSVTAIDMKTLPFVAKDFLQNELFLLYCLLYFSPMVYFLSINITKERKKKKDLMKMMGLQDSAFWFSWGLLYAIFIFIISIIFTIIIKETDTIMMTNFTVIFTLFFLYGTNLIALTFLMTVLIKRTALTTLVTFSFTIFWGGLGFTAYYRQLPASLEWILCIFSPFAFIAGMTQIIHQDYNMSGVTFPDPSGSSYSMIATFSLLAFDTFLYLVLTLYFDKILPYENNGCYSALFFLNSLPCLKQQRTDHKIIENETETEHSSDDNFEPIPPEYQGKEVIRISNIKKEYKGKSGKVEALKGLSFDIAEGQITAILGQNGAGKSSLLNILSGLSAPTEGSVTIYNKNLSDKQDLEEIKKIIGICPQNSAEFDLLTVKENLKLFAKIKGIQSQVIEQEIQRILLELDIQNIQDQLAQHLNEGQKRKLTFGIAILGDPRVLLLDEPTVGVDPFSRHRIWSFLKEHKNDRVILLSTNFLDEVDYVADRKVIMSNGRIKSVGSSEFLKRRWGLGYNLSLYRNETCDPEKITSFIHHHIPEAKLKAESKEKLVYSLPLEKTNAFPELFSDLDKGSGPGVMSYDVSISTLNEIFTKLERGTTIQPDFEHAEVVGNIENLNDMNPANFSSTVSRKAVSPMYLWRMQVCAMAKLRFLKLKRERKELLTLLFVFGIALYPLVMEKAIRGVLAEETNWELKSDLYFLSPGQLPQETRTTLLIINNTESNIEDFIQSVKQQNILLEIDDFKNRNGTEELSYNGVIIVSGKQKDYRFSIVCNTKRIHCFPILMNIISNGVLRMLNNTQYIRIGRGSFQMPFMMDIVGLPESTMFVVLALCNIFPYIAMSSVSDYQKGCKSQLWISGLFPSAYWCGQALVDIALYGSFLLFVYILVFVEKLISFHITGRVVFALFVISLGYVTSMIFMTYMISFIFRKRKRNSGIWSFVFYFIMLIMFGIIFWPTNRMTTFIIILLLFPNMGIIEFLSILLENITVSLLLPCVQALVFLFILRCLEMKYGKKILQRDPIFRISPQRRGTQHNSEYPRDEDEDEDVHAERTRTATALTTSNSEEKPVILASCLHKEYVGQKKYCFLKRKKNVATKSISFCVQKGEILGLLGPTGAGKSSCMKMISGAMKPTAGEVELNDYCSDWDQPEGNQVKVLGYCPQKNVLWSRLTVKEHLQVFASVKGLNKNDATTAILRLVNAFKLHEQLNVPVCKLTAGATRKLCFLLSILGDPPILLLDEPSTGVDSMDQLQMWKTIQGTIKNTGKGALIVTHHLAEAEALCDRIAIMVSGKLRCIGSIQHLKRKFGKDYTLKIKVKETSQLNSVNTEILKLFPQAIQQERYAFFLTYKLPMMDVQPLSQAFHKLEAVKHNLNLDEYSLSQCTLEKVFLELSKEQLLVESDEEVGTTVRWRLLPYSDEA